MTGIAAVLPDRTEALLRPGEVPPRMVLPDIRGNTVALPDDFKGRVVLIHFWASWCPSCRNEMALLESIYSKYGQRGVMPCSIDVGERKEAALGYIRSMKITYPILLDSASSVARQFGVSGIPTFYVLNRTNVIRFKILGKASEEGLERMVKVLL
jgi:thiol-disulfide isomerase/thioredoxin